MACDSGIAKLLSHIHACHSAILPGERLKFFAAGIHVGYVRPEFAETLRRVSPEIEVTDHVTLTAGALPRLNEIAIAAGCSFKGENFDVRAKADGPVLTVLDRGALPDFGVVGVGAHMNGLVRRPEGWHLWVGERAKTKKLDPGKLDHLVAGGVPAGLTPFETLIKEAEEEASLPKDFAAGALLTGRFAYGMERQEGLRRDVIFAYDLVLPENFTPHPGDGEVERFFLWPLPRVLEVVRETNDFKFNVNLVLIDLFIRFGLIPGEGAQALRAALNSNS